MSMRRVTSILLLVAFAATGSGLLQRVHAMAHEQEDAVVGSEREQAPNPSHDDSNCNLHLMLSAPIVSAGWVPLLVLLGVFVAFLTQLPTRLVGQFALVRIDCRGPPLR